MMEKAFECALILTDKHKLFNQQIAQSTNYSNQKELRKKQAIITKQMIDFLEEIQEFKSIIFMRNDLKEKYQTLINYYSSQILLKIDQYQMQINFLTFETKFTISDQEQKNNSNKLHDIEYLQDKLSIYYQLIKK